MHKEALLSCHQRIQPYIHKTPVLRSTQIDKHVGGKVFFKCENFQKTGAYKMRGAANAIMQLTDDQRSRGVITHSSGNFAQALSLAAKSLGVTAHIVMPHNSPEVKKQAVKSYDGIIHTSEATIEDRQSKTNALIEQTGATFIHPSNDLNVIYGQGTAALELLKEQPNLDIIVTPVGGGGLIAGTSLASHYFGNECKVVGGEPLEADDAYRSLISGKIEMNESANTIADGLRTQLGDINFPIILEHVSEIIRVTEIEIIDAMRLVWERMKIIIEPSSAVALAAVLKEKNKFTDKNIGIIISGGNVDVSNLPF